MLVSVPDSVQRLFPGLILSGNKTEKKVYLTFDDGPVPEVTLPILDILKEHNALATFFEVGENVERYSEVHQRILKEGHQTANHTFNHLSGWKTKTADYLQNIHKADSLIGSKYFRPPYGRIKPKQIKAVKEQGYELVFWNVLSKDYDKSVNAEQCLRNCTQNIQNGSIVLMHDSIKAKENVLFVLPKLLGFLSENEFEFGRIDEIQLSSS